VAFRTREVAPSGNILLVGIFGGGIGEGFFSYTITEELQVAVFTPE
jgi:hypothetical protein